MKTITPDRDLLSIGKLCELNQCTPNRIERAAEHTGAAPALRLNGATYWDSTAAEKIAKHIASKANKT